MAKMAAHFFAILLPSTLVASLATAGCTTSSPPQGIAIQTALPSATATTSGSPSTSEILQESWLAYRQRFIQADGRIIDREASDRSTSEAQAYAMLRAVLADDPETFDRTLRWSENNLQRKIGGIPTDSLWVWQWGKDAEGNWGVLDPNFASDADVDAITALIFAARRWNRPDYLELAQTKLQDLWELSTVSVPGDTASGKEMRYLLPGPATAFQPQPNIIHLNPSYLAPYAFRLFAQVDPQRDWLSLVESSYHVLEDSATLSAVGLPSDWVALDTNTGKSLPLAAPGRLRSQYGFDAYRVWWRLALDAVWFNEPQAEQYLQRHLAHLRDLWRSQQSIPAEIDLQGQALVDYEATPQYAMLYAAFRLVDPTTAEQIRQQKLIPQYHDGFWDNDSAYYIQNLAWFGLFPPTQVAANLLQPQSQ